MKENLLQIYNNERKDQEGAKTRIFDSILVNKLRAAQQEIIVSYYCV